MKYRLFVLAILAALGEACSGSSAPTQAATVVGTFGGQELTVADSAGFQGSAGTGAYLAVVLSSGAGVCSVAQQHATMASTSSLQLLIQSVGATNPPPLQPGTYAITNGDPVTYRDPTMAPSADPAGNAADAPADFLQVSASFDEYDASCAPTLAATASGASSGTITVTSVSSSLVDGTFNLQFPSGDHLTGHFSSPLCSGEELALTPVASGGTAESNAAPVPIASACVP